MREEWKSGDMQETLLLPTSIGDSQPRDRRLPASSLDSATTTGKKRRAKLIDKTCGRERCMKTVFGMRKFPSFHKKEAAKRQTASTFSSASGCFIVQFEVVSHALFNK